jgi:rSAM/selenodomain-associated transferase 2
VLISIIVPVLADTAAVEQLLTQISPDPRLEVIVVDGAADSRLDEVTPRRADVRVLRSRRGRAVQMNAGAGAARGEWLLFLHADSRMPGGWLDAFERATRGAGGGWFRFTLDHPAWQARLIERGVRWRVRWLRLPYGDQGLFARRDVFASLGGYRDLPLMEDVDFVRRLAARARLVEVPAAIATSARRWERDGWLRRSVRNTALVLLYFAGVAPSRLAAWYSRSPGTP